MSTPRNLSNLTREQKLELIALLQEKQRRERERKVLFQPHPGQLKVIESPALEKYLFPGNGYGKTALLVNALHWAATGFNPFTKATTPVPAKIALVVATAKDIEEVIAEYCKWFVIKEEHLHKKGKPYVSAMSFDTGSTVTILTHEVSPLSLEGSQWTHIFLNEPPPKPVFIALSRGGRIKGRPLQVLLAGTPIAASWLRTDVYEPWSKGELPHVECFFGSSYENNANLEEGALDRFAARLSEKEKAVRLHGQFFDIDGLALAHLLNKDAHLIKPFTWERTNPCVVVVDPHPSKAHHAVLMGVDPDNRLYVIDEYKEKAIARKFTRSLHSRGWFTRYTLVDIVSDSLGSADTTSGEGFKSFIAVVNEELGALGVRGRCRATTYADKSDEDFVERIQDSLAIPDTPDNFGQCVPKLRVFDTCRGTWHNLANAAWLPDKANEGNKPKLDIAKLDYLACVKYALATNLYHAKKKEKAFYHKEPAYGVVGAATQRKRTFALKKRPPKDDDFNSW